MRNRKRGPKFKYEHLYQRVAEMLNASRTMADVGAELGISAATVYNIAVRMEKKDD